MFDGPERAWKVHRWTHVFGRASCGLFRSRLPHHHRPGGAIRFAKALPRRARFSLRATAQQMKSGTGQSRRPLRPRWIRPTNTTSCTPHPPPGKEVPPKPWHRRRNDHPPPGIIRLPITAEQPGKLRRCLAEYQSAARQLSGTVQCHLLPGFDSPYRISAAPATGIAFRDVFTHRICRSMACPLSAQSRKVDVSPTHFVHPSKLSNNFEPDLSHHKAERWSSDQLFLSFNPYNRTRHTHHPRMQKRARTNRSGRWLRRWDACRGSHRQHDVRDAYDPASTCHSPWVFVV